MLEPQGKQPLDLRMSLPAVTSDDPGMDQGKTDGRLRCSKSRVPLGTRELGIRGHSPVQAGCDLECGPSGTSP